MQLCDGIMTGTTLAIPRDMAEWLSIANVLPLIRAEYLEIPRLHLTQAQVERLWGIDGVTASTLLCWLVQEQFLRRTQDNAYVRAVNEDARPVRFRRLVRRRGNDETEGSESGDV